MLENSPARETFEGYDLWARDYDHFSNPLVTLAHRALVVDPLEVEGKRILELGCGTGRHAMGFLRSGAASYTGVDGSAGMLEQGRGKVVDGRATFVQGDLLGRLPLAEKSFDVFFFSLVLEHVAELVGVFRNVVPLLAAGGRLRILELHADRQRGGTRAHFVHEGRDVALPSFAHEEGEYRAAFAAAGLTVTKVRGWAADAEALELCPKLGKYEGREMLIDVEGGLLA